MQGSSTVMSFAAFGQPSKAPAAGRHGPSAHPRRASRARSADRSTDAAAFLLAQFFFVLRRRRVGPRGQHLAGPPGAERVLQQEEDHVVLGEELGHGRQFVRADLDLGLVDPSFWSACQNW